MTDDPEMQALTLIDLAERLARGEIDTAQYQGAVGRLGGHAPTELPEEADAPSFLTPDVPAAGMSAGDSHAYASWMANILNALELLGQDVEDIASDADDELDGSGWNVARNPSGHWSAVRDDVELASLALGESFDIWALLEAGGERAPKGGITIAGKFYQGGRFIPATVMASASPEDKARLEQAKANAAVKAEKKTIARHERGSIDTSKLASRLQSHADAHPLSSDEKRWAASAARMLHRHHGAMTAHRIEELADRLDRALHEVGDDHPNSEGLRSYFGRQLAKLHQALGHAKDKGVTGEVVRPAKEPATAVTDASDATAIDRKARDMLRKGGEPGPGTTQKRAVAGGEVGPNGEWYPAGAFIATTDLPKRVKEKLEQGARKGVLVDDTNKREVPQPGQMSIYDKLSPGWFYNPRSGDFSRDAQPWRELSPEKRQALEDLKARYDAGERWVSINDHPDLANPDDVARLVVAKQAIPGAVLDRLSDDIKSKLGLQKYQPPGDASSPAPDAPGFTGTDAQGRQWQDGELVARQDEPAKDAGRDATDEPADDIPINSTQLPIDNKPGSGHNVSSDRSAPTGEKKMFAQPRTVFAVSGFNGPYSKQEQVMKALGVTWDAGASRNVVPEDKIEAAKAAGFKVEKREVAPPPPIPDEVASQLSRYGMNPDRYSPVNQFDKPYEQIARWLQEKHPVAIRRLIVRASSPEEKAALAQRLAEVEADPTTDQLPTRFEFFKKGAGTLKAGTATYGEIKAWRSTPNRIHRVENQEAFWTESPGARDGGHATVKHRKPGDTIDGIGVVADFRRIGDANEYLVRPFTKAEKRVNDQVVAAREATEIRSALGNPDSMFHPTTLEQEAEMRKRLAELDRIAAGLAK